MNKFVFKVSDSSNNDTDEVLSTISQIEGKVLINFPDGLITAENISQNHIRTFLNLIVKNYKISEAEIDTRNQAVESSIESCSNSEQQALATQHSSNNQPSTCQTKTTQIRNDTFSDNSGVKFQPSSSIEFALNKLIQTAYWALVRHGESEDEITDFIWNPIREMSATFSPLPLIDIKIGDVVECYFGKRLPNEISGSSALGIVANILNDDLVYVIPITKTIYNMDDDSYLPFSIPNDISQIESDKNSDVTSGTVICHQAAYIQSSRVQQVVGKVTPAFMIKILEQLPNTFDFRDKYIVDEAVTDTEPSSNSGELALSEIIAPAIKNINPKTSIGEIARRFIDEIGIAQSDKVLDKLILQSFIASYNVDKITYKNICNRIKQTVTSIDQSENQMELNLKSAFKSWASSKPALANYQYLAFTSLLKLFIKAVKKDS